MINQEGQYERILSFYRGDFYLQGVYKENIRKIIINLFGNNKYIFDAKLVYKIKNKDMNNLFLPIWFIPFLKICHVTEKKYII